MIIRKAVRAILVDSSSWRVLLVLCVVPDTGIAHWITPGGGIDEGESPLEA